ncbi:MAG TPA: tripartite tricarboxylate transporter TctB family protein [Candidatus Methylomirabilis sp.]|nr:tripartite tricarboxylate transporter TctB family protein [Candidatus Methylomirabilis sp.]
MKKADALLAGIVLLIGIGYEGMAWRMPRGSISYPGPGYFPVIVGLFLILTAAGCVIQSFGGGISPDPSAAGDKPAREHPLAARPSAGKAWGLLGLLAAYALFLKPLGFLIAIFLFLLASIRVFGYRRWLPSLGVTAAIAALSYVSFVIWLKVPLPLGILGDILD